MLPNKLTDFFDKPAFLNRTLFYTTILLSIALAFIAIFGIFYLIFPNFTFPNNAIDYDNERYLLSALVQSLAATIALVITLSLVAVQLAAQSYSARVIDVYKRNPDMWILLCIYIITIFYGLGLTKIIGLDILGNYIEGAIFGAYFMGFFAFVCLVPYMLKTLDLLKPSTVIKLLAEDITKKQIIESLENYEEVDEKDPVQPIVDMVNGALERNDYETVKNGLVAIKNSVNQVIEKSTFEKREEWDFSGHLIEHIERLGKTAIKNSNERSTISSIKIIEEIGIKAADRSLEWTTWRIISTLHIFARDATPKNFGFATRDIVSSVEKIGTISINNKLGSVSPECVVALKIIGFEQLKKKMEWDIEATVKAIVKIGYDDRKLMYICIKVLRDIGIKASELGLDTALRWISDELKQLGIEIESEKDHQFELYALIALGNIGIKAAQNDMSYSNIEIIKRIGEVGTISVEKRKKMTTGTAIRTLEVISENCTQLEMHHNSKAAEHWITKILDKSTKIGWDMPSIIEELRKENYDAYIIEE